MNYSIVESRECRLSLNEDQAFALINVGTKLSAAGPPLGGFSENAQDEASVLRATRLPGDESWRVFASNVVGVVQIPGCRILISSKIPAKHLWHLLREGWQLPREYDTSTTLDQGKTLPELVCHWYVRALERLVTLGLLLDYSEREMDLNRPRGEVCIYDSLVGLSKGRTSLACRFEDFDLDTPLNRTLREAGRRVLMMGLLSTAEERRLIQTLRFFDETSEYRAGDLTYQLDRRSRGYATPFKLACLIMRNSYTSLQSGTGPAWVFVFSTPAIAEEGIRQILRRHFGPELVVTKGRRVLPEANISINPDLVFGASLATGDVKYKVQGTEWLRSDLYQAVSFASGYEAPLAFVFAMDVDGGDPLRPVQFGSTRVSSVPYPCGEEITPDDAAAEFASRTRTVLEKWGRSAASGLR